MSIAIAAVASLAGVTGLLLGVMIHETIHWAVAERVGARVTEVRLVPPHPQVCFTGANPRGGDYIRASTVLYSPVFIGLPLVGVLTATTAPTYWFWAGLVLGYLPKSRGDWAGFLSMVKRL